MFVIQIKKCNFERAMAEDIFADLGRFFEICNFDPFKAKAYFVQNTLLIFLMGEKIDACILAELLDKVLSVYSEKYMREFQISIEKYLKFI